MVLYDRVHANASNVAIATPYRAQIHKYRRAPTKAGQRHPDLNLHQILIGTAEHWQGSKIIYIHRSYRSFQWGLNNSYRASDGRTLGDLRKALCSDSRWTSWMRQSHRVQWGWKTATLVISQPPAVKVWSDMTAGPNLGAFILADGVELGKTWIIICFLTLVSFQYSLRCQILLS